MQDLIRELIVKIGENPEREGLIKTPERVAKSYEFLTERKNFHKKSGRTKPLIT